jgi:DNA-binding transcriptional LysR family regulator
VTFNQLRTFRSVAHAGSFARAAEQLDVSQPTVSELIRSFEDRLERPLFLRRNGAAASLTASGQETLDQVNKILEIYDRILGDERVDREKTVIKLSLGNHLREINLRPMLPKIYHDFPGVEIELCPLIHWDQIPKEIESGTIDLAVFTIPSDVPPPADALPISDVRMVMVGAPGTRARLESGACSLDDLQYLFPIRRAIGERFAAQMLDSMDIAARIPPLFVEYVDVLLGMVEQGEGVGTVQAYLAADRIADGRMEVLDVEMRPLRRMILRSRHAPPIAQRIEEILRTTLRT